jgi:hypothetical protein
VTVNAPGLPTFATRPGKARALASAESSPMPFLPRLLSRTPAPRAPTAHGGAATIAPRSTPVGPHGHGRRTAW